MVCVEGWGGLCEWCVWKDGEGCVSDISICCDMVTRPYKTKQLFSIDLQK